MNERFQDINNRGVPIYLGIDDDCQKEVLCGKSCQDSILLGNVWDMLITSGQSSDLDVSILVFLKKHVGLQHHLPFFVGQIPQTNGNERITEVQLFHFSLGCWMVLISPLLQASLEWYLGHDFYHYVRFGLLVVLLWKHVCIHI